MQIHCSWCGAVVATEEHGLDWEQEVRCPNCDALPKVWRVEPDSLPF